LYKLSMGSGLMLWLFPMLVAALTLRPASVLVVACVPLVLMIFPSIYFDASLPVSYAVVALFAIALLCWLVATILRRVVHDARQQAENAIHAARRQSENIEAILNTINDGVLVLDLQGNFISANQALIQMIPEDKLREINSKPLEETLEWKRTVFSVSGSLLPGMGSVLVFRDETRRHEADRARDALLAIASHELRTPLGSVMNYIELLMQLLAMGKINSEKFTMYLVRAYENSQRLLVLINNIIDQAQLQARVLDLKWDRCNLPALLEKSRQLLSDQIKEKDLSYELTIAPDVPEEIISDSERLHQVLMNLIGNAIKFTHKGGVKVNVSLPSQETLSIQVTDTGPGIPYEQLPDIFEVFRRGSNYATRNHQGAGLGLSIVKELVNRMGGEVSADSTIGLGSVFIVSLPLILPEDE
jgi:signal transduction histidine kinase